jgi:hypothetical protein
MDSSDCKFLQFMAVISTSDHFRELLIWKVWGGLPALRRLSFYWCNMFLRLPDLSKSRNLEEVELKGCEMELCEEDIRMLASLPLLQPVEVEWMPGILRFKLDVVRRKMLRQGFWTFEWEESDLGIPPIKIEVDM